MSGTEQRERDGQVRTNDIVHPTIPEHADKVLGGRAALSAAHLGDPATAMAALCGSASGSSRG